MLTNYVFITITIQITQTYLDREIWSENLLTFGKGKSHIFLMIYTAKNEKD